MSENNEPTITVNVDTTELSEKIDELKDEAVLKRDKEILTHIVSTEFFQTKISKQNNS